MAKHSTKKKKKTSAKQTSRNILKNLQLKGNELFKQREFLIGQLELTRTALQTNLQHQHELEEKIKNG